MAGVNCTGEHQQPSHTDPAILVLVGITCCLSVLGTLLIISSYLFFKGLRTPARLILVHLSFMDLGIALAHLTGVIMGDFTYNYYNKIDTNSSELNSNSSSFSVVDIACKTQATLTTFFTLSSFFWTGFLAVYMYFRIVHISTNTLVQRMLYFSYLFCYGCPLGVAVWMLLTGRLGYTRFSGGWCSLIVAEKAIPCAIFDIFAIVFGYDIWAYTTFILASVLYISVHVHIRLEFTRSKLFVSSLRFWTAFQNVDYKFLLIPLAFILLRVWSCIITIIVVYCGCQNSVNSQVLSALFYLEGIGDSGQGFINGLLFVAFTKRVRNKLFCFFCQSREHRYSRNRSQPTTERSHLLQREKVKNGGVEQNAFHSSSLSVLSSQTSNINY